MKKLIVISGLVAWSLIALSQGSIDIFTVSEQFGFQQTQPGNVKEKIFSANLKVPVILSDNTILYKDFNYFNYQVNSERTVDSQSRKSLELHGIILQAGVIQKLNDKQALYVLFVPRIMSDLRKVRNNDFQFGGIFLYENKFHDDLTMRFGGSYNQDLFGPYVVPMVYVNWNASSKICFTGLLPIYSKVSYQTNKNLSFGIHHLGMVTSYQLNDDASKENYIENNRIELNLFSRYKITNTLHTEVRVGYSLTRSYTQYLEDDKIVLGFPMVNINDNRFPIAENSVKGALANIRLIYNLSLSN
jgi:hypothetical protein